MAYIWILGIKYITSVPEYLGFLNGVPTKHHYNNMIAVMEDNYNKIVNMDINIYKHHFPHNSRLT